MSNFVQANEYDVYLFLYEFNLILLIFNLYNKLL
jgi:hypothetical protein